MNNIPRIEDIKNAFTEINEIEFVAEGGFKAVFNVIIKDKHEALKIIFIPTDTEDYSSTNERILREVTILERLDSPYIVKLGSLERGTKQIGEYEYICYSEEFLFGENLRTSIKAKIQPPFYEIRKLFFCLLKSIRALKEFGVIHRDIKPDNVIRTGIEGREYVLLDLGLAFIRNNINFTPNQNMIPGTINYYAPEMLKPNFRNTLDYRADLYSAALTVYEFATSRNPFENSHNTLYQTLMRIERGDIEPLEKYRNDLPQDFCNIVNQSLKTIPALRPGNIDKLINQVEELR